MEGIIRVNQAIRHQSGVSMAKGELTMDRGFMKAYIQWLANGVRPDTCSDTDLLIETSRGLGLDLVCLPSDRTTDDGKDMAVSVNGIRRLADEGLFIFRVVDGSFQRAATSQDMMSLLTNIAAAPHRVSQELQARSQQVVAALAQVVAVGAHGIIIADDIAYRQNTYMSPDFVRQYLLPVWQVQVAAAKNLGVPVFFHSDGNLNAVLPCIVEAGFDGLQCIEPAADMDIRRVKTGYGDHLCLMGNIAPSLLCAPDDPREMEVRRQLLYTAVSDLVAACSEDGGLIFGTCSGLHAGMAPELVHAMHHLAAKLDPAISSKTSECKH